MEMRIFLLDVGGRVKNAGEHPNSIVSAAIVTRGIGLPLARRTSLEPLWDLLANSRDRTKHERRV